MWGGETLPLKTMSAVVSCTNPLVTVLLKVSCSVTQTLYLETKQSNILPEKTGRESTWSTDAPELGGAVQTVVVAIRGLGGSHTIQIQ